MAEMKYLAYVLTPLILILFLLLVQARLESGASQRVPKERPLVFRVSRVMYFFAGFLILCCVTSLVGFVVVFETAYEIPMALTLFFVPLAIFEIWRLRRTYVEVTEDELIYRRGSRQTIVSLSRLQNVMSANGYFMLDVGGERTKIPVYFRNASALLALLRDEARSNRLAASSGWQKD